MWNNESERGEVRVEREREKATSDDEFFNKTDNYFCLGNEKRVSGALVHDIRYESDYRIMRGRAEAGVECRQTE